MVSERGQDDTIQDKRQGKNYGADRPTVDNHKKAKDVSVSAGDTQ
jgi:hypothetical protein